MTLSESLDKTTREQWLTVNGCLVGVALTCRLRMTFLRPEHLMHSKLEEYHFKTSLDSPPRHNIAMVSFNPTHRIAQPVSSRALPVARKFQFLAVPIVLTDLVAHVPSASTLSFKVTIRNITCGTAPAAILSFAPSVPRHWQTETHAGHRPSCKVDIRGAPEAGC